MKLTAESVDAEYARIVKRCSRRASLCLAAVEEGERESEVYIQLASTWFLYLLPLPAKGELPYDWFQLN